MSLELEDTGAVRLMENLKAAFGPNLRDLMDDVGIVEIMLNPDGKVWIDRLGSGRQNTGLTISESNASQIIYLVSSFAKTPCTPENPIVSAELPDGSRFQGMMPPIVVAPTFTIRKKAIRIFTLQDYVSDGILSEEQKAVIISSAKAKKNILIAGGTGSGKTTLVNAVLKEIADTGDRLILIEDTVELQCSAEDMVPMRTRKNVSMNDLLRSTMRLRPDRIVVGEVRGPEALSLLKAWNTGHPGGCATIHANSAVGGLTRLEQLIKENPGIIDPQRELIAEAVNLVVFIERFGVGRRVKEIIEVEGYENNKYMVKQIA